jgi:glucosamine-6-phosphate isomerase
MMNIKIAPSYALMSRQAAQDLVQLMAGRPHPLLCTASGHTPTGLYGELIKEIRQQGLDISRWKFVGLDEWLGMNGSDEGSCQYDLQKQLFQPLGVKKEQICFFDGRAADGQQECRKVEAFIQAAGGLDVAILGVGLNGHIGMNEPGTPPSLRSHVAAIDPLTQQTGQKYFAQPQTLTHGLTLGLATLMEAKHILLLANGAHKAGIASKVVTAAPSADLPATLLRSHADVTFYLDQEAAHMLPPQAIAVD